MKTKYIALAIIAAASLLTSCDKLLDIPRKGVIDYNTFYKDDSEIESAGITMYSEVRGLYYNMVLAINMLTDDHYAGGAAHGDNVDMDALGEFGFNSETGQIESTWSSLYSMIYDANVILGHIDPAQSEVAARTVAEAHLFRGWAYFNLASLWGNPPIVDHELVPSEYEQGNGSTEDIWKNMVEGELLAAINSGKLPQKANKDDKSVWRVTKQFGQALLGKAYLWMATELNDNSYYAKSAEQFAAVVNSGLYELFTEAPYGDIRNSDYKMNCEDIFESIRVNDTDNQFDNFDFYGAMVGWRNSGGEMTIPENVCGGGWGFMVPTPDLLNTFESYEGKNSYRRQQTLKTYEELRNMGVVFNQTTISTGIFYWKGRFLTEELAYYSMVNTKNPLWMRYAEVLLCGAEANFMAGKTDVALSYVNMIRERAQLPKLTSVTLDQIKTEKRLELCGEGLRYQDLVRWGDAYDAMKDKGKDYPTLEPNGTVKYVSSGRSECGFKKGKHERLPYPYTEIMLNHAIQQNPGY